MNGLIVHAGAQKVPHDVLAALPKPEKLGRFHAPVPHVLLVDTILAEAEARHLKLAKTDYALTTDGAKLFALFQFDMGNPERSLAMAVRNATDQSLRISGVAGGKVFICDNLALSGDTFLFGRKNTTALLEGKAEGIIDLVKDGFGKFVPAAEAFDRRVKELKAKPISGAGAELAIYRAFVKHEVAALRYLPKVHEAYFVKGAVPGGSGEYPEVDGSVFGLHNAFTRVFKDLPPTPQFHATRKLGAQLGL